MTPIPTPFSQRWREFRIVYLPVLTFLLLIAAILLMWKHYVMPPTIAAPGVRDGGLEAASIVKDASETGH